MQSSLRHHLPVFARVRRAQVRLLAAGIGRFSNRPIGKTILSWARRHDALVSALVAERRPFPDLGSAIDCVRGRDQGGHLNSYNTALHAQLASKPRPSDYAAFYNLVSRCSSIHRVFDLGGNVGNLFYYYSRHLPFPGDLVWTVHDLPEVIEEGRKIAAGRSGAERLAFTTDLSAAAGADLFLSSGSLHYFEEPLADMLARVGATPRYILINRTPLIEGPTTATVQDAREFLAPCILRNRTELIAGLEAAGYRLVDSWEAQELSLTLPFHPELSARYYSGLFLERVAY